MSLKSSLAFVLCLYITLPELYGQQEPFPNLLPKWEFGLRAGVGINTIHLGKRQPYAEYFFSSVGTRLYGNNRPKPEFQSGIYVTRRLGQRWAARSELSLISKDLNQLLLSLGVFPRYRVNKWLSLETGLEMGFPVFEGKGNRPRVLLGTVFGNDIIELHGRFSPSYQSAIPHTKAIWLGAFQAGASIRLAKLGRKQ